MNEKPSRIDLDELINEIRNETGVRIAKGDPILDMLVGHEYVLNIYEERWESHSETLLAKLENQAERHLVIAKNLFWTSVAIWSIGALALLIWWLL